MSKQKPLTTRQQRFVEYYDGNAVDAAKKAGYKHPYQIATRIIARPQVKEAIRRREARERRPHIADRKRRQEFWTAVMEDQEQLMKDRLKASENLARSEADFVERREHSGLNGGPISIEIEFVNGGNFND